MRVLYKYPTRERPLLFSKTLVSWYENMKLDNFEFLVSCDADDRVMNNDEMRQFMSQFPQLSWRYDDNKSKIEACNRGVFEMDFDIVVLVSDDMVPQLHGYDEVIVEKMKSDFPDTDGALWFFDGFNENINTLSILGRKYYNRFGYIYHPSYTTQWCDQEHTDVATASGRLKKYDDVIVRHIHPEVVVKQQAAASAFTDHIPEYASKGFAGHDKLWLKNSNGDADRRNYFMRREEGFPS